MAMTDIDYHAWAQKYDDTRGVSPSVLGPLLDALGAPDSRSLLDIGGGTGNYTVALRDAGFRALHCDPSPGMVRRAASKLADGPGAVVADGQALPFRDGAFDCAIAVKVLNHVAGRHAFAREARRVLRSGPLVLVHATKESIAGNWICHYAPSLRTQERFEPESSTVEALKEAGFAEISATHVRYADMADGSAQALKRLPETFLTPERILNTSLFSRLPDAERRDVLASIRRDYESGRLREVIAEYEPLSESGGGAIFVARP